MDTMFMTEGVTKSDRMLHTPGRFALKSLLYVQEVGILESLSPHVCHRENLDSYLIFMVLDGSGTVKVREQEYELHKGECVWIDCHQPYEHISSEKHPWKLAWVHFNGVGAGDFYELFRQKNDTPVFIPTDGAKIQTMMKTLLRDVRENVSELENHGILTQLLIECLKPADEKEQIRGIREYVNENYQETELMKLLERRFQLSKEKLEEVFLKGYGIDLRDYIISRRFNAAKELLRFTIKPISAVISESGIGNEDLFYQLFKENEGMSPEEYRKNWAQWIKD